jgi:beta-lactam-binding protein with PASTA domain/tRNA A-37 threonylcarbamoyl transferase component Bud32
MSERPLVLGGRYRIERELGRGGMAKVFEGTDAVLGRQVAVKILAPQFADDEGFVQRFRREAQAAARLSNPNLVSVYDTGDEGGVHYIVMEYVEGKTLADYLAGGGRIMSDRAIEVSEAVANALSAAHAQGVIHRDIKPGNIMLTPTGQVKVTDFGIARMTTTAETVAQTAAVLGTASYLSPEQAQGQPVDGRSDIYSLGCVLYEMVTGRPPFLGDSPVAVASKQVLEQPLTPSKLNPDVTPDLDAVILRALAKNPANRYQSAEEFREDLDRVRRGLPVEATPVMPPPAATQVLAPTPAPEEPSGSRWWIPALVIGLILLGIAVVVWLFAGDIFGDGGEEVPGTIVVPNVVDMKLKEATTALEDAGLVVADSVVRVEDPELTPGTVVSQDPAAGAEVEEGTEVTLTAVKAPGPVVIPTVVGLQASAAQLILEQAGFVVQQEEEASDTVAVGAVTRTDPPESTEADYGSTVTLYVSSGPGTVAVPEVRCLSFNSALNKLEKAGLNGLISEQPVGVNPSCPLGNKVAAQDPAAGTPVEPGSTVTLYPGQETTPTGPTGPTGTTGG